MRILIACIPTPGNRYLANLIAELSIENTVIHDYEKFWTCDEKFDVVHIHWPEYLSYELESYLYNRELLPTEFWGRLNNCLTHWQIHSTIVYTVHNLLPHARKDKEFEKVYETIVTKAQLIVHFANHSLSLYKSKYPQTSLIRQVVIPHHNYSSLYNENNHQLSRKELGISTSKMVMLVFGTIYENEKKLIHEAFSYIPISNKLLLAPGWKIKRRNIKHIRIREWVFLLEQFITRFYRNKHIHRGYINEAKVQHYLNSADILLIPRMTELNSGNIALGYTFGLVVIGRNSGNIGEILSADGNPTFEIGNSDSLKQAIELGCKLKRNNHGAANKARALNDWNVKEIVRQYLSEINKIKASSQSLW